MAIDLVIEVDNEPGALAKVTRAISDAGVNISAATFVGGGERAELHFLVPHTEPTRRALEMLGVQATREREVVVVDAEDRPGELADLARKVGEAGINIDLLYVATRTRVVFGADDIEGLKAALGVQAATPA